MAQANKTSRPKSDAYGFVGYSGGYLLTIEQLRLKYENIEQKIGVMWASWFDAASELDNDLSKKTELITDTELYRVVSLMSIRLASAGFPNNSRSLVDKLYKHLDNRFNYLGLYPERMSSHEIGHLNGSEEQRMRQLSKRESFTGTHKEMLEDIKRNEAKLNVRTAYKVVDRNLKFEDNFLKKLQYENMWTLTYTYMIVEEYKRFLALMIACPKPVSPSDAVDQVWHQHILDMSAYKTFTEKIGKTLFHNPSKGNDELKFKDQYNYTLIEYEKEWGKPLSKVWPSVENRFNRQFIRICSNEHLIIHKPSFPKTAKIITWIMSSPMRSLKLLIFVILMLLACGSAISAPQIPNVRPRVNVWDPNDLLSPGQEGLLNSKIEILKNDGYDPICIAVKTVAPYGSASEYAEAVYHTWQPGTSSNHNGILFLVTEETSSSTDPRDLCRIMTGWNTMEILNDATVINDIKHEHMMVHLPNAFKALDDSMTRTHEILITHKNTTSTSIPWAEILQTLLIIFAVGICVYIILIIIRSTIESKEEKSEFRKAKTAFEERIGSSREYYGSNNGFDATTGLGVGLGVGYYSSKESEPLSESRYIEKKKNDSSSSCGSSSSSSCGGSSSSCGGGGGCGGGGCGS